MKRQRTLEADIIRALREENAKLTHEVNRLTECNDDLLRQEFGESIMPKMVEWLFQACRDLARGVPDTVAGLDAKRKARQAFDAAGFTPPGELKNIRKKSPRQKKRPKTKKPR